ncbi:MAG TPA: flagellar hook assembly protein FlgD [Burkholderiaceae bacterium]|nr:flagellar hook assembly protein FlgD [Burkholderiaceae bacterium]
MSVSTVNGTSGTPATATSALPNAQDLSDTFLKLLVAQMNNQDPLNPMDNSEVTSQLAQINTVTGLNSLNSTVTQLLSQFGSMESLQAAQLTGRSVLVSGNTLALGSGGTATAGVQLDTAADNVTVQITDASGQVVRTMQLGQMAAGTAPFTWNGLTDSGQAAPAGTYAFTVTATAGAASVNATALAVQQVTGVRMDNGTLELVLAGGGVVPYSSVNQIL